MKKIYSIIIIAAILTMVTFCGNVAAQNNGVGPAPNSGDCIPDGSGFDRTDWPNEDSPAKGPAPNSGDCIPDGSGF
ncbi:hypothetical protein [[Eubacterium] cellulosolvens]